VHGRSRCRSTSIVDLSAGECLARGTPARFAWRTPRPDVPRKPIAARRAKAPAKSTPAAAGSKACIGMQWGEKGPAPGPKPSREAYQVRASATARLSQTAWVRKVPKGPPPSPRGPSGRSARQGRLGPEGRHGSCVTSNAGPHGGCVTVREMKEGPSGSAIRSLIPSHCKLLSSKAMVVNVAEKSGR
jgi:hypothetical protein